MASLSSLCEKQKPSYQPVLSAAATIDNMQLNRAHIESVLAPYLKGDFDGFVRQKCTPNFRYELAPGDLTRKLGTNQRQHEFAGTFIGHDNASTMILEGLTGKEVKDMKINARILNVVIDADAKKAAVELELFGDARRTDKPFVLANSLFFDFDNELKITYWADHLDTFTLAKLAGVRELEPELP